MTTKRYAVVGTGGRSQMYIDAITREYSEGSQLVAFVDTNSGRMEHYNRHLAAGGHAQVAQYGAESFDVMVREQRPDAIVVTSPDDTHAGYIIAALERGVDVVCEKPMTIDGESLRAIVEAERASSASLVVTFNYRYSPRNTAVRELVESGAIGRVTSVHFEWCLDTVHGADYFRRWHREKARSGGLLVHKSTHHFDLVNWWIDGIPELVFARGGLHFYGDENARERGLGDRRPLGREMVGTGDPFVLDLARDEKLKELFLDVEHLDGYARDRDVFSEGITIEDNLALVVGYESGAMMSYSLNAHSPWEGYRVAVNGTAGRIELEVVERAHIDAVALTAGGPRDKARPVVDPSAAADDPDVLGESVRPFGARLILQKHWEPPQVVEIEEGVGSHGGGDRRMLDEVFLGVSEGGLQRQADYVDGIRSVLIGVAANQSLRTGRAVELATFGLPLARELDRSPS